MMETINKKYLFSITIVTALGGLLFGYDWVVIGGAKPFYEAYLGLEGQPALQGWAMSSALVGCILGVTTCGSMSDRFGRKPMLLLAAGLFAISAILTGFAEDISFFCIYRIIGGVGVGIASAISPLYIAEVSPATVRGRYVSINQLTIVIGILLAQITNMLIAETITDPANIASSWNGTMGWRVMFWMETIPAMIFLVAMTIVPESPKWMFLNGYKEKASAVFRNIGGEDYVRSEVESIESLGTENKEKVSIRSLFKGKNRKIMIIGVVLAVFQQWCGINVIFNYAQEIFTSAGYSVSDMFMNIVVTGSVNLIFTIVALYTVDKLGRRVLMRFGAMALFIIYAVMGTMYLLGVSGLPMLILVVLAIASYAVSLAPVTWVLLSEIFPARLRGRAMAVSTAALWIACFILTYTFPLLNTVLGSYGTFWLYGLISILGYLFVTKYVPETKQRSLEEIEQELYK